MHVFIVLVVAAGSVLVLWRSVPELLRRVRDRTTRLVTLAAVVLVWGGIFGDAGYLGNSSYVKIVIGVLFGLLLLLGTSSSRASPEPPRLSPVWALLLLWLWLFVVNLALNSQIDGLSPFGRIFSGVPLFLVLLAWRRAPMDRASLSVAATTALGLVGLVLPIMGESAWRNCDKFKCGIFDGMLVGPFTSENYLGMQAIFVAAMALVTFGWRKSIPVFALVLVVLLATESRTSQIALAAGVAAGLVIGVQRLVLRARNHSTLTATTIAVLLPVVYIVLDYILVYTATPASFSNRGGIWLRTLYVYNSSPLHGLGLDRWVDFQNAGILPDHYPHSTYLLIAFSGGIVAIVLFATWLFFTIRAAIVANRDTFPIVILAVTFLTVGLLEVTLNLLTVDGLTWHAFALLSIAVPAAASSPALTSVTALKKAQLT